MKSYSDLLAIDHQIDINIKLRAVGSSDAVVVIGDLVAENTVTDIWQVTHSVGLLEEFSISIKLLNKIYTLEKETAIIIDSIYVDNIELVPDFVHLSTYTNDHNATVLSNYLGFNGTWQLNIDRPFYQWLHQVTGQGWLLTPSG